MRYACYAWWGGRGERCTGICAFLGVRAAVAAPNGPAPLQNPSQVQGIHASSARPTSVLCGLACRGRREQMTVASGHSF